MKKAEPQPDGLNFEQALARLEEIVQKLEKGDLPLEDSLGLYEEGIRLSKLCHGKLEEAEGRIELLLKDSRGEVPTDTSGKPKSRPLAPQSEDDDVPF